jgi:hypothetical protein
MPINISYLLGPLEKHYGQPNCAKRQAEKLIWFAKIPNWQISVQMDSDKANWPRNGFPRSSIIHSLATPVPGHFPSSVQRRQASSTIFTAQ